MDGISAGGKLVKDRLKQLFEALGELIKEVIQDLKGSSEQEVTKNKQEEQKQDKKAKRLLVGTKHVVA